MYREVSVKPVKRNIAIALGIFALTGGFLVFQTISAKRKLEAFNNTIGKNESVTFMNALQTVLNDNKIGTFDENVKFVNAGAGANTGIIEIKEKMFIAQTNDIYLNSKDYVGKTIKLEGVFKIEDFPWQERPFYYVLRYGPGCCGFDGSAGFEVIWDANKMPKPVYPNENDWVEAVGVLSELNDGSIYIALTNLKVLDIRGVETVRQ